MFLTVSFIAAVIPMTVYLLIIWKMDKYEPEPLKFVLAHFLWGGLGAVFFALLGSSAAAWFIDTGLGIRNSDLIMAVISAPIIEEFVKSAFLAKTYYDRRFDNITDGLVYGGAIGLGFGMTENFFYFITYGDTLNQWIALVIIRTAFSAVMHCVTTGLVGAFLGYVKYLPGKHKAAIVLRGLFFAMIIHASWNLSVSFDATYKLGYLFMFLMILIFITVFAVSLKTERNILATELTGELPEKFIKYISGNGRFRKGWIDESVRIQIIRDCTNLAFRKRQLKLIKNDDGLAKEIEMLRNKLGNYFRKEKDSSGEDE